MKNPVLIERDTMTSIGNAIRNKGGATTPLKPGQMPAAINSISGGGVAPCIITGTLLAGCPSEPTTTTPVVPHSDWDKVKNLIDYENAYYLAGMFSRRKDLEAREVEEFLSHSMPNVTNLSTMAYYANFIDDDIVTHVFDLTLDSPNCTAYANMFVSSNIRHLKLTITEHNADFLMSTICNSCAVLQNVEIKGPGLSHATSFNTLSGNCTYLQTATIGDDDTNYARVTTTLNMFSSCPSLKTLTIKGVNVLPLSSTASIPSTIESIKVPAALVNSYKTATNWSSFASKISAI